jgi:hypothetical protein
MKTLLGIICLIIGHDPDANDIWFVWADESDVFCVYPYQQRLHRCRRCHRYVKDAPGQLQPALAKTMPAWQPINR